MIWTRAVRSRAGRVGDTFVQVRRFVDRFLAGRSEASNNSRCSIDC